MPRELQTAFEARRRCRKRVRCILNKVVNWVTDKALQKAGEVFRDVYAPNLLVLLRDPAHMVRISCQDPLNKTGLFASQYQRLFGDQHALLKDPCAIARLLHDV